VITRRTFLRAAAMSGGAAVTGRLASDAQTTGNPQGSPYFQAGSGARDAAGGARHPRPFVMDVHIEVNGALDDPIASMDRDGIAVSVVVPARGASNDAAATLARSHPNRLIGIGRHDSVRDRRDAASELERCVRELGMRGMTLDRPHDRFDPDDERLFPVYEKAIELDVPLTFHTGWTPLVSRSAAFARPAALDAVGARYPDLRVVLAHVGGPAYWHGALAAIGRHPNFTCDLSSWRAYPSHMLVEMLNRARDLVGLDRVLFGSERTLRPAGEFVERLRGINGAAALHGIRPIAMRDVEAMLGANAARVYKWRPV
jgi:predicted TIM-barrel fold metal-dependent hydrolase